MVASRTGQPWAGRVVTETDAYYKEICNLFSKTPERRNPVQDSPQAICQTDNSFTELQRAGMLGYGKCGQAVSMLLRGYGVPRGLQGVAAAIQCVGLQGNWDVEHDGCYMC